MWMHNCLFVALLLLALATSFTEAHGSQHWWDIGLLKTRVEVRNGLEGGQELRVHCKSGDDDLHLRVLKPHNFFSWSFHPNLWGSTQFYCAMDWGEGRVHWFDIYIWKRDYPRCGNCLWIVKQSGPCFYDMGNRDYDFCYPWNPGSLMKLD
ncbi:unnamed protein product [Linum trigynum]|uniref:S-protein homolog n=2 Tax=Linum TaxID=4005 RepID=A0AAV2FH26_9ROSI